MDITNTTFDFLETSRCNECFKWLNLAGTKLYPHPSFTEFHWQSPPYGTANHFVIVIVFLTHPLWLSSLPSVTAVTNTDHCCVVLQSFAADFEREENAVNFN